MQKFNRNYYNIVLGLLVTLSFNVATADSPYLRVDSSAAVTVLLNEAEAQFRAGEGEQAAASLERALRIDNSNPILWHNLAGVRLQQEDWERAANLAAKSNTYAVDDKYKWLRVRNFVVISLACQGMRNTKCAQDAQQIAQRLAAGD